MPTHATKPWEKRISTWAELDQELQEDSWNKGIKRFRSNYAFRGLNNANYKLENGLSRMGKVYDNLEENLVKQFKKYAYGLVVERDTQWHWLSIAQHHGLPTRLLDWTYSPLIALHFATSNLNEFADDGAVWKVNFADAHKLLQDEHRAILQKTGANIFSVDDLHSAIENLDKLDAKHSSTDDIAIFFEPPSIDERIINQFAYFSAISDKTLDMDDWLIRPKIKKNVRFKKIIIPSTLKWEIRDRLDQFNINERVLFPGLDGLCTWLKRHYKPAP